MSRLSKFLVFPAFLTLLLYGLDPAGAQSVNAKNLLKIGRSHAEQKDWIKAKEYADLALAEEPGYLDALYLRAFAHRQTEEYEKAEADFREVLRLDPQYLPTYGALGEMLLKMGETEKADKVFAELSDQPGGSQWASYYRGVVAYTTGDLDKAESFWKETLDRDTLFTQAVHNLGALNLARGSYPQALNYFRDAVEQKPEQARYRFHLAYALEKTGQLEAAQQALRVLLNEHAEDQRYWLLARGYDQLLRQQFEPAGKVLKTLSEDYPEGLDIWLLKARVHLAQGQHLEAREALLTAREIDSSFSEVDELWGRLPVEFQADDLPEESQGDVEDSQPLEVDADEQDIEAGEELPSEDTEVPGDSR